MTAPVWRTQLTVRAFDEEAGREVLVAVGLIDTENGGVQLALRVGEQNRVLLPLHEAHQLEVNLHETLAERVLVSVEQLEDDKS